MAIDKTEIPDCSRIWARARFEVSWAKFVSAMSRSAWETFSKALFKVAILVWMTFDCRAPIRPLSVDTWLIASVMIDTSFEPWTVGPTIEQAQSAARAKLEQLSGRTAEFRRVDGRQAEVDLAGDVGVLTDLEDRAAAGDGDRRRRGRDVVRRVEGHRSVERSSGHRRGQAAADRCLAVDRRDDVGTSAAAGRGAADGTGRGDQRALQHVDADELRRSEVLALEGQGAVLRTRCHVLGRWPDLTDGPVPLPSSVTDDEAAAVGAAGDQRFDVAGRRRHVARAVGPQRDRQGERVGGRGAAHGEVLVVAAAAANVTVNVWVLTCLVGVGRPGSGCR